MISRLYTVLIAALFFILISIVLVVNTFEREREFDTHQLEVQKAIVHGAAYSVSLQLRQQYRNLKLFADEYRYLLLQLIKNENDIKSQTSLETRLRERFPDYYAYTITNAQGGTLTGNIDALVGEVCQREILAFAQQAGSHTNVHNLIQIHPQPGNYHYDLMVPIGMSQQGLAHVFFVSFFPKALVDILKTYEIPGHSLLLVKQSDKSLIEITRNGLRDILSRPVRLSEEEILSIKAFENIEDTDWRLVNLPDKSYSSAYKQKLWKETLYILLGATVTVVLLLIVVWRNPMRKIREH